MKETAVQVNERKIRNGIRKQAEKIWREKQKVWDKLTDTSPKKRTLAAGWTIEPAVDVEAVFSQDLLDELTATLTTQINAGKFK